MKSEYPSIELEELLLKFPNWNSVIPQLKVPGNCVIGMHDAGTGLMPARFTWIKFEKYEVSLPKEFEVTSCTL